MTLDLFCPGGKPDKPFLRKLFLKRHGNVTWSTQDWTAFLAGWSSCPHPLKGKHLRVASQGTNPFIYTDYDRNVVYNDKGLPLGENAQEQYMS
jgi:hypothetical protein